MSVDFDPYSRAQQDDPYPVYRALRDRDPVHRSERYGFWALSRYDDVQAAARDWETFSHAHGVDVPPDAVGELIGTGNFLDQDPPSHDRMRHAIRDWFRVPHIKQLEVTVRAEVEALIARFAGEERADLVRDFAGPLPGAMVCDLLGFPRADLDWLQARFDELIYREPGEHATPPGAVAARAQMRDYIAEAIADRRRTPREDLLSLMVAAEADGQLSVDEVTGMCILLFVAGILTTSSVLGNGLRLLASRPEDRRRFAADPALLPDAVEELLRFAGPVQYNSRVVSREVTVGDRVIPAGARVLLLFAAANRDERRFEAADELRFDRGSSRHLAFGNGLHFCLGAHLARLEARIALEGIVSRIGDYAIDGPVVRAYSPAEQGLASLPVRLAVR